MSCSRELKKLKEEAVAEPTRDETPPEMRLQDGFRLGYAMGFHNALDYAIEIAEEAEDD